MKRETRQQWTERVERWRRSGRTAGEFAAQEGVRPATLSWWGAELKRTARASPGFIEVAPPSAKGSIEVVLGERVRIRVSGTFDAELLRQVVAALEGR
jgi:hypothetical protein